MNDKELENVIKKHAPTITSKHNFTEDVMNRITTKEHKSFMTIRLLRFVVPSLVVASICGMLLYTTSSKNSNVTSGSVAINEIQKTEEKKPNSSSTEELKTQSQSQETSDVDVLVADIDKQLADLPSSEYDASSLSDTALYN